MEKISKQTEQIMNERFGKDSVISLATVEDGVPYVRNVNAYYENGAFYVITYGLSAKMRQIENSPVVALAVYRPRYGRKSGIFRQARKRGNFRKAEECFCRVDRQRSQ